MFDPYHKWLAIPKDQRPPTYYQLLGISPGESDSEVIEEAALMRIAHVRNYQLGPHAHECSQLLRELGAAGDVLSDPRRRAEYDAELLRRQKPASTSVPEIRPAVTPERLVTRQVGHTREQRPPSRISSLERNSYPAVRSTVRRPKSIESDFEIPIFTAPPPEDNVPLESETATASLYATPSREHDLMRELSEQAIKGLRQPIEHTSHENWWELSRKAFQEWIEPLPPQTHRYLHRAATGLVALGGGWVVILLIQRLF